MKAASALVFLLAATFLSGCLSNGPAPAMARWDELGAADLLEGQTVRFHHEGGPLALAVQDGHASIDLFDGSDARIGHLDLDDGFAASVAGPAGDWVLRILELQGNLSLAGDAGPVTGFLPLTDHLERHVLVDRAAMSDGLFGLAQTVTPPGEALDVSLDLVFLRPPVMLDLLGGGDAQDLSVHVRTDEGLLFEKEDSYAGLGARLVPLGGVFHPENTAGTAKVQITATSQQGPLVLQSWSYSRLTPATAPATLQSFDHPAEQAAFTYGELPDRPVRIEVSTAATALLAWTEDITPAEAARSADPECEVGDPCSGVREDTPPVEAWFTLYGPDDARLGTFRVQSGQLLSIPVLGGGDFVLVHVSGPVMVGADVAPRDFELHVLDTRSVVLGEVSPGDSGTYGQLTLPVQVDGVPYEVGGAIEINSDSSGLQETLALNSCPDEGSIRLLDGNETLGFWGSGMPDRIDAANLLLPSHGVTFVQDGFDGTCGQVMLRVTSYLR